MNKLVVIYLPYPGMASETGTLTTSFYFISFFDLIFYYGMGISEFLQYNEHMWLNDTSFLINRSIMFVAH
jgi:hypothetical protein